MVLQSTVLALLALGDGAVSLAAVAAVLLGFGTALVYPILIAAMSDAVTPVARAPVVGVYRSWRDSGYVAGAVIAGTVADALSYGGAIAIVVGLTAASGLGAPTCQKRHQLPAVHTPFRFRETDDLMAADRESFNSIADAYDRHVGRYGAQLAAGLIEAAGIRPGDRVLDVGCGPGPLTRALGDRVGDGNVAAIDPSPGFAAACRARVPGADVRVGVAEQLPFASGAFDAALAQLVVQLMDDRDAGVAEMIRVTRPGGVLAACVWDSTTMPLLRAFWDAALDIAPERAGALDDGRRVGYRHDGELADLWEAHGLVDVTTGELWVSADYASFDDLFEPFTAGTGHSGACYAALGAVDQRRLRDDARRRLGEPDHAFTLTARAWCARGTVPGS